MVGEGDGGGSVGDGGGAGDGAEPSRGFGKTMAIVFQEQARLLEKEVEKVTSLLQRLLEDSHCNVINEMEKAFAARLEVEKDKEKKRKRRKENKG